MDTLETVDAPNFSIIVPTGCNAKCSFCFWKKQRKTQKYEEKLLSTLQSMPEQFWQISITGSEPTLDFERLDMILRTVQKVTSMALAKDKSYSKVVFTTNGYKLLQYLQSSDERKHLFGYTVNHVNISRHHWKEECNNTVFGVNSGLPTTDALVDIVDELNMLGIDVNINCVLAHFDFVSNPADTYASSNEIRYHRTYGNLPGPIWNMIMFAKVVGASSISFREPCNSYSLEETHWTEDAVYRVAGYNETGHSSCPVCKSTSYIIKGMHCFWKYSIPEPVEKLDELYEVVFHPNGKLTADWAGKIELEV